MKRDGAVTIFLSLILVCVSALLCGLVESARTAGVRFYLQTPAWILYLVSTTMLFGTSTDCC